MDNDQICDGNCLDCKHYYQCESEMKITEQDRDFWLNERGNNNG